jgi:hypothetical protein
MNPSSWSYLHLSNSQLGPLFHRSIHWPNWAAVAAGLQSKLSKQRPEGENDTERAAGRPGDASDRDDPGLSRGWLNSAFLTFLDDRKLLRLASWVTIYIYIIDWISIRNVVVLQGFAALESLDILRPASHGAGWPKPVDVFETPFRT